MYSSNRNKKLKLNTKKIVFLSTDEQNAVQGGMVYTQYRTCRLCPKERNLSELDN